MTDITQLRVAFETLGCKLNFSETSTYSRTLQGLGYQIVKPTQEADLYIINTCSVTEHSDKKCRNMIRRMSKKSPDAIIVVTGCYAQLKPSEILDIQGVNLVVGAQDKGKLVQMAHQLVLDRSKESKIISSCEIEDVNSFFSAYSSGERTRSFLKVQDGCDYHCAYCTVPLARGDSRNIPIAEIVKEAENIAADGIVEIVITGVNTGDFGKSTNESFLDLLKALNDVKGIERYRISSIEPNLLTPEIIDWISKGNKFLPHFHIPLQSGCDKILAKMRRRYNTEMFRSKIELIRAKIPDFFLGIDVIVGFPGESDEDFRTTYNFLESIKPSFLHIFPYSRRANTPAAIMPDQVPEYIKNQRVTALSALSDKLHSDYCTSHKGKREYVLFESTQKDGKMFGYTRNYIRVERPYDPELIGKIVEVVV